jgi:hypothetical protein
MASATLTSGAAASPEFPAIIQQALDLECVPQCLLCHRDNSGGRGSLDWPFGELMFAAGLRPKENATVRAALDVVAAGELDIDDDGTPDTDSDDDMINDVDELRQGTNPNPPRSPDEEPPDMCADIRYGCGARIEPRGTLDWGAAASALAMLLVLVGRFRRSARRPVRAKRGGR